MFDTACGRVDKVHAAELHALNGRKPIQLVVQRSQRQALLEAVKPGSPWRVDPKLQTAVDAAIVEYNRVRAPLYPLPKIQRLGYLDEQDDILCNKDLGVSRFWGIPQMPDARPNPPFSAKENGMCCVRRPWPSNGSAPR